MTVDIETTFARLKAGYASGRTRPPAWRRRQLDALRRMVREHRDDFVRAAASDLGKPAEETMLTELMLVSSEARFVRDHLHAWMRRHPKVMPWMLQPAMGWTVAEPKGVVLIIAPWNYPTLLALEPLADALAAGDAACVKPSELAPATSRLLAALIPEYLDAEAVAVIEGGPDETGALLRLPFDHIFYTGGGKVGKVVMRAAAEHLTSVTLELGGKSPCFVDATADLVVAARRIAWGKFTNAGQTCVAPDYVLATSDVAEALATRIGVAVTEFYGDDPQRSPDYGRIVNERHFDRLCALLPEHASSSPSGPVPAGRLVCGGTIDRDDRYIAPTVLYGTDPDAPVMGEEIFGPILPIIPVRDADEAIAFVNGRPRPLAAYVFSRDRATRLAFERRTSSGALGFGLPLGHLMSSRLPFGGVGASGIGAYHGEAGFLTFSHVKTVTVKPSFPDTLRLVYPPFDAMTRRVVDVLRRLG
ncbi:aldehyde dehydrogenase family protein [Bifidobacterium saguinibicoloris]|uniref:aldehyde dehydrogenase family protein n=1 Tax=Bifidobacterium saguinibicoloris TaxID=2834433 RepID=UPI001C5A4D27|nr:aldehyde dehydrogenase family protein [Bifidobacterium saguinibicoloris]MBW3080891.1 aldehyde dehydrogenase family protein [Bifidobacterium saguinibicoloris]